MATAPDTIPETLNELEHQKKSGNYDGAFLEDAVRRHCTEIPDWEIGRCWRYEDWPGKADFPDLPDIDTGIDLVAEKRDGTMVAIQCKGRSGDGNVTEQQVDRFKRKSPASIFGERWFVAEAGIPASVRDAMGGENPVVPIDFLNVLADTWSASQQASGVDTDPRTAMQHKAIADCVQKLRDGETKSENKDSWKGTKYRKRKWMPQSASRCQLILPCGTGKTRVSAAVMHELCSAGEEGLGIVLVPSIALISQVRREYLSFLATKGCTPFTLAVCSDKTAGHVPEERLAEGSVIDPTRDTGSVRADELDSPIAQGAAEIAQWLRKHKGDSRIIFSTYQSAHHTAEGLQKARQFAQVLVLDEAHRTAQLRPARGKSREERLRSFTLCHEQDEFPARYRLYQTATPRVYTDRDLKKVNEARRQKLESDTMDNQEVFGHVAYRLSYLQAVKQGLLSDYRIIGIAVDNKAWDDVRKIIAAVEREKIAPGITHKEALAWLVYGAVLAGAVRGKDGRTVSRSLAFSNRVSRSKAMAGFLNEGEEGRKMVAEYAERIAGIEAAPYEVQHLDAGHSVRDRRDALRELGVGDPGSPQGISNVGIFGEGTDSPSLDAVALLAPRRSPVEIIQIVGRVMRRSPDKSLGYVIVPVPLPRDEIAEVSLRRPELGDEWAVLSGTLQALRAHDGRIEEQISTLMAVYVPPDPPEPVTEVAVLRDGPTLYTVKWTGTGGIENAMTEARVPHRRKESSPELSEYLTSQRGFQLRILEHDPEKASFSGSTENDTKTLAERRDVFLWQRDRYGTTCDTQPIARTDDNSPDVQRTIEKARKTVERHKPLRRKPKPNSRRKRDPKSGKTEETYLFELDDILKDELGGKIAFEVMEKSGLCGHAERDFNLLMAPVNRAADHLRNEQGVEKRLRSALQMNARAVP